MEYRQLIRNGVCSLCGDNIPAKDKKVIVGGKWIKHKKTVIICADCADEIKKEISSNG